MFRVVRSFGGIERNALFVQRWMVTYVSTVARNGVKAYWSVDELGRRKRVSMKDIPQGATIKAEVCVFDGDCLGLRG